MNVATRWVIVALFVLPLSLTGSAAVAQSDAFLGTWVFNAAKSKVPPVAAPDSMTFVVTAAGGDLYKQVSDSAVAGTTVRSEVTLAVDGKDYATVITPAPPGLPPLMQAAEKAGGTTVKTSLKLGGQVIATTLNEISADGKTLTMTTTGLGDFAAVLSSVYVLDKK